MSFDPLRVGEKHFTDTTGSCDQSEGLIGVKATTLARMGLSLGFGLPLISFKDNWPFITIAVKAGLETDFVHLGLNLIHKINLAREQLQLDHENDYSLLPFGSILVSCLVF